MEIRQNKLTREWIIFAPNRKKRPKDFRKEKNREELPEYDKDCPFCAGNEDLLVHPFIIETPGINYNPWQTRVLPNKYPALEPDKSAFRSMEGIYIKMPGYGKHEIFIDHPKHNICIGLMKNEEVRAVIETYWMRYNELMKDERNLMVIIFKNHGPEAGASLSHSHSQLISTGMVPSHLRVQAEEAQRYYDDNGRCVMCDIIGFESKYRERVIIENNSFISFIPYAAEVPFEIWIVPKRHEANFGDISEEERITFAEILREAMKKLYEKLNDPDFNYVIISAPRYKAGEPHLHWYLRIMPHLTTRAGFEIGSGIFINPSLPEEDASFLKD
ncbi:MAG: galactose-1-phosphate uridylyltransferase [candidate division WOR-3 bacterium]|nr:galactose-1-phosphate uridylyltransferase [candidate division WOR-3 bacterium]